MSDPINESFSAFIDGQASDMDIQRLLKAMDKDASATDQWQALSDVQAGCQEHIKVDVLRDVQRATHSPHLPLTQDKTPVKKQPQWLNGAIAASVMAVVLVSAKIAIPTAGVDSKQVYYVQDAGQSYAIKQGLNDVMQKHYEQAALNGQLVPIEPSKWQD